MKTDFNEFVFEYLNDKHAIYILNRIVNDLSDLLNLRNIEHFSDDEDSGIDTSEYKYYKITRPSKSNPFYHLHIMSCVTNLSEHIVIKVLEKYKKEAFKLNDLLTYDMKDGLNIYYKDIYVKRIKPERYLYHSTNKSNVEKILTIGLIPQSASNSLEYKDAKWLDYPDAIFFTDDEHIWHNYGSNSILRIDTSKINNIFYEDMNISGGNYYVTYEKIPAFAIKLVDRITLLPI